jgi:hypothetical protein
VFAGLKPDPESDRSRERSPPDTRQEHGVKFLTDGSRTLVYGKNDPFRSWPISANELEEVAMGSETNL